MVEAQAVLFLVGIILLLVAAFGVTSRVSFTLLTAVCIALVYALPIFRLATE